MMRNMFCLMDMSKRASVNISDLVYGSCLSVRTFVLIYRIGNIRGFIVFV